MQVKDKTDTYLYHEISNGKDQIRFAFDMLMAILLIYVFYPKNIKVYLIDRETALLLYVFGFLLLINANWDQFFGSSYIIKKIQTIVQ